MNQHMKMIRTILFSTAIAVFLLWFTEISIDIIIAYLILLLLLPCFLDMYGKENRIALIVAIAVLAVSVVTLYIRGRNMYIVCGYGFLYVSYMARYYLGFSRKRQ